MNTDQALRLLGLLSMVFADPSACQRERAIEEIEQLAQEIEAMQREVKF